MIHRIIQTKNIIKLCVFIWLRFVSITSVCCTYGIYFRYLHAKNNKMLFYALLTLSCIHPFIDQCDGRKFMVHSDVVFELHTRDYSIDEYGHHNDSYDMLTIDQNIKNFIDPPIHFDANRPTRIFVHGYQSKRSALIRYAKAYLKMGDVNFIAVNWIIGSSTINYLRARGRVERVSMFVYTYIFNKFNKI